MGRRGGTAGLGAALALGMAVTELGLGQAWAGTGPAETRSCGWSVIISDTQANVLFPDTAATYWTASVPIPAGGHVEIHGQFPHARYTSLTTYTSQFQSIDGLHDTQIQPDPGSTNSFRTGADRDAANRDFTLRIVKEQVPVDGRQANTIYTTSADGSKTGGALSQLMIFRIFEGDEGQGESGGVPLPAITLVGADGRRTSLPDCPDAQVPDVGLAPTLANAGTGDPYHVHTGLGGTNPPVWHKFTNPTSGAIRAATENEVTGEVGSSLAEAADDAFPYGGMADNPDNKYVTTYFSQAHGQVLAFRAKAPTHPHTYAGQRRMGTGQVRLWSFCTNSQATQVYACKLDDQVPVDRHGYYTIVVSTAAARPRNATEACGVAWLPAGAFPQSILILRNMLPAPSFTQAIQNAEPGTEADVMGDYYPRGTYYATTSDYERLGCARR